MTWSHRIFIAAVLFLFLVPDISSAATVPNQALIKSLQSQIAALQAQLAQLQASSTALTTSAGITVTQSTAYVTIPLSGHADEAGGRLRVTFMAFERPTSAVASTSAIKYPLGKFLLDYSGCATVFCPNPAIPTAVTELQEGQSTVYRDYKITLDNFAGSTADITINKPL